jgi:hypothetical protein
MAFSFLCFNSESNLFMSTSNAQPTMADLQREATAANAAAAEHTLFDSAYGGVRLGLAIGVVIGTGVILSGAMHGLGRLVFGDR